MNEITLTLRLRMPDCLDAHLKSQPIPQDPVGANSARGHLLWMHRNGTLFGCDITTLLNETERFGATVSLEEWREMKAFLDVLYVLEEAYDLQHPLPSKEPLIEQPGESRLVPHGWLPPGQLNPVELTDDDGDEP